MGDPSNEAARELAGRRKQRVFRCVVCGRLARGLSTKRYCGRTCAQRAHRQRKRKRDAAKAA